MQTKKLKYLLMFAVIAIAAAVAWYFAYWVKNAAVFAGPYWQRSTKARFCGF